MPGACVILHRDSEQDVFWLAGCSLHSSLALRGVTALAGATIQPPSLAESGFLAEVLGQPSQHRQAAASSWFRGKRADPLR